MTTVQEKNSVAISYIGKLDNGQVFAHVNDEEPLTVTIGNNDLPPSLEQALIGMEEGEQKKVVLGPDEGYGPRMKNLLQTIDISTFGNKFKPKVGMALSLKAEHEGKETQVPATIVEINGTHVTVDYNHPLAGHNLTYTVKIEQIL
ncbi:MAG: peptidylprolyl isomerase [Desulfobulbaceae bacterium]|uniref:Peptidyl-prolyl cis-trans isomerase n=1 Tax=Candidatus Desulfatifera sulfidica TaxID=2841691 RepID=A0A8J6TEB8_9BACT|nr:peptidylprolyl isomerase [Candidatus Desulfatifera sulfidica]